MSRRALLSVSDKTGLVEYARGLIEHGYDLIATSSTSVALAEAGVEAQPVADVTGFPEMLDGRVRTLHPAIHAGILARRDDPEHMRQLAESRYEPIDMVVVSLYPFAETLARGADDDAIVENIDIGGPSMIRAAAKNRDSVAVVVSPVQYGAVLSELREHGSVSRATRHRLATEAFAHVAAYDTQVAAWLRSGAAGEGLPAELTVGGPRLHELRYGENPHQRGALYAIPGPPGGTAHARQLQGTALSFTNWLDVDAARALVAEFDEPAACIIKHTNPCGFAVGENAGRRVPPGVRMRPAIRVRRHRRGQSTDRPPDCDRADRDLPRGRCVSRSGRRCGGPSRHQAANPGADRGSAVAGRAAGRAQHRRRAARADPRSGDHRSVHHDGGQPASARRRRVARTAYRVAGGPPCQVQRRGHRA